MKGVQGIFVEAELVDQILQCRGFDELGHLTLAVMAHLALGLTLTAHEVAAWHLDHRVVDQANALVARELVFL